MTKKKKKGSNSVTLKLVNSVGKPKYYRLATEWARENKDKYQEIKLTNKPCGTNNTSNYTYF